MVDSEHSTDAPPPSIFIHEDVSKAENRTNLALLGALMVPEFRFWFLGRLGFPPNCVLYPPQTTASGLRPDFVAVNKDGVQGWIEVELAGENLSQMEAYHKAFDPVPVKCIVGKQDQGSDLSLEELALQLGSALQDVLDLQQRRNAELFVNLVNEAALGSSVNSYSYVTPDTPVQNLPLVVALATAMGSKLTFGTPPLKPGELQITTTSQRGWSLRKYCKGPIESSVSLLWNPTAGKAVIRIPSYEKLEKYLGHDLAERLRDFWRDHGGVDIAGLALNQNLPVAEDVLSHHIDEFAQIAGD